MLFRTFEGHPCQRHLPSKVLPTARVLTRNAGTVSDAPVGRLERFESFLHDISGKTWYSITVQYTIHIMIQYTVYNYDIALHDTIDKYYIVLQYNTTIWHIMKYPIYTTYVVLVFN